MEQVQWAWGREREEVWVTVLPALIMVTLCPAVMAIPCSPITVIPWGPMVWDGVDTPAAADVDSAGVADVDSAGVVDVAEDGDARLDSRAVTPTLRPVKEFCRKSNFPLSGSTV